MKRLVNKYLTIGKPNVVMLIFIGSRIKPLLIKKPIF